MPMHLLPTATAAPSVAKHVLTFALQVMVVSLLLQNVRPVFKVLDPINTANAFKTLAQHAKQIQSALILQTKPVFANNHI